MKINLVNEIRGYPKASFGLGYKGLTGTMPDFWRSQLAGKRVCIIGNAPSIVPPHLSIDEHDIVIRFNDYALGGLWGSKTSFYCSTFRKEVRTDPDCMRAEGVPLVCTGSQPFGKEELTWEFAGSDLEHRVGCWPSSGLMAIHIAFACKAAHVTLAAMTLAYPLTRELSWGCRYAPPWAYHNFLGERRVVAELLQTFEGSIDLSPALDALRKSAFNQPDPRWETLASALMLVSREGQSHCKQSRSGYRELDTSVHDMFHWIVGELSTLEPAMEGVRQLESYFHLSTDKRRHRERWLLFHPVGAHLMDDLLSRLRALQTICR